MTDAQTDQFQIGDVVRLKSGGPAMTITEVGDAYMSGRPTVWCAWFDAKGRQSGDFPPATLEKEE